MRKTLKGITIIKYFIIVLVINFSVIVYLWQNIEVMKINLEYKKLVQVENELVKNNDRLLCETEKFKRMNNIERYAGKFGYRKYVPSDYNVLKIKGNNAK